MFELRQDCSLRLSVKTRVIEELRQFPATVRELESAGCGAPSSIRRVLKEIAGVVRFTDGRYALRGAAGYKLL